MVKLVLFLGCLLGVACSSPPSANPPNTVNVAMPARVKTLDPAYSDDRYSNLSVGKIYETLFQYHYLKRPYVLEGLLADGMPLISKDRKTLTFKIKKGVTFHDDPCFVATQGKGRELLASDFAYAWKRLADPKVRSSGWWIFDGKIVGLNDWRKKAGESKFTDYSLDVPGLKALDDHTLQITLTASSEQFLFSLAMPFTSPVPKEAVDLYGEDFARNPVGTGPYIYRRKESNLNSKIILDRNPNYRKEYYPKEGAPGDRENGLLEDAGKPLPRNDRVVIHIIEEDQPNWLNFMSGKLDVAGIPKDNFSSAVDEVGNLRPELSKAGVKLIREPASDLTFMGINLEDPILGKNKTLRQAISRAIDEEETIRFLYNGRAVPALGPIPPGVSGYDPSFKNPNRTFNLIEAKKLMAKAGYPEGKGLPELVYYQEQSTTGRQYSEVLIRQLGAIGVKLKIVPSTWPDLIKAIHAHRTQLFGMGWGADYPDGENFLQLFYSRNIGEFGTNYFSYKNGEFDSLYEQALRLPDGAARNKLYQKMARMVAEDVPAIFSSHRITYGVVHPWVKNVKNGSFGNANQKYYRIDPAIRAKLQ